MVAPAHKVAVAVLVSRVQDYNPLVYGVVLVMMVEMQLPIIWVLAAVQVQGRAGARDWRCRRRTGMPQGLGLPLPWRWWARHRWGQGGLGSWGLGQG